MGSLLWVTGAMHNLWGEGDPAGETLCQLYGEVRACSFLKVSAMLGGSVFGDMQHFSHCGATCNVVPPARWFTKLSLMESLPRSIWGAQAFSETSPGKATQWLCLNWGMPRFKCLQDF